MSTSNGLGQPGLAALRLSLVVGLLAIALVAGSPIQGASDQKGPRPSITDVLVSQDGPQVLLSFQLQHAFDNQMSERIQSGLPSGFTYHLRLARTRRWWFDRGIEGSTLEVSAMYNAITREYLVNYKQDGRLLESRVLTNEEELRDAMTTFSNWPAFQLETVPRGRTVVRLRAELGSRTILAFIPTTIHTDWAEVALHEDESSNDALRRASG